MSVREKHKSKDEYDGAWDSERFPDPKFPPDAPADTPTDSKDLELKCVDCGNPFTFTVAEQQFFLDKIGKDYQTPKRCKVCRAAKRARQADKPA